MARRRKNSKEKLHLDDIHVDGYKRKKRGVKSKKKVASVDPHWRHKPGHKARIASQQARTEEKRAKRRKSKE